MEKLIIFSAPSGAGKTTVVRHLLKVFDNLDFSISATTRPRREGERAGYDYYFLSEAQFKQGIEDGKFVEYEEVYTGLMYGTLKSELDRIWSSGKAVLFDVDVIGGLHLKRLFGDRALAIFVKPPSLEILEQRLRARGTESEEKIRERIRKAADELKLEPDFDVVLLNDDLDNTLSKATAITEEFLRK